MKKYNVQKCIYGHLHGASINDAIEGIHDGITCITKTRDGGFIVGGYFSGDSITVEGETLTSKVISI